MAGTQIEKVSALLGAVRAREVDRAVRYVDPRHFVHHHAHAVGGLEGWKESISGPTPVQWTPVRIIEDGPYVVAQAHAEESGRTIFLVYRFEGELIAEHWAFSAPGAPPNKSGHTQLDGPTEPKHLQATERNKELVHSYYQTFHIAGDHSRAGQYFKEDQMIRHEPGVRDGVREFLRDVEILMQSRTIDEMELLLGQGDLVFIAARGTHEDRACSYLDLYRVEDEKIVEHWGFPDMLPPREEWKNNNGVL